MFAVLCMLPFLKAGMPPPNPAPPVRIYTEKKQTGALDVWLFARTRGVSKAVLSLAGFRVGVGRNEAITQPLAETGDALAFPPLGLFVMRTQVSLPKVETYGLKLVAKLFSHDGRELAQVSHPIRSEIELLRGAPETCLIVSRSRQRLYAQRDGTLVGIYKVSTGRRHSDGGGPTPLMKTRIFRKSLKAFSNKYRVWMRYFNAITPNGLYGIHATSPRLYRNLGRTDSHGCVRLHADDARQIFASFPVGTYVEVKD
jgi:hypothetical protein